MCNFIEWVDMENPQNDETRAYPRSETRSDYLRRKDEHERRIAAEALEWHVNPLGLKLRGVSVRSVVVVTVVRS